MNSPLHRECADISAQLREMELIEINDSEAAYSSAVRQGATCNELARRRTRINTLCSNYAQVHGIKPVLRDGAWN